MSDFNLPHRNGTWVMLGIAVVVLLISLKWVFFGYDLSQFIIYALSAGICLILAFLLENQSNIQKKQNNLENRLDSIEYPEK